MCSGFCFGPRVWGLNIGGEGIKREVFPKLGGFLSRSPYVKDYRILESTLGSPYFGKLPFTFLRLE